MALEHQTGARHTPLRTCVVCREKDNKRALVRIVRTDGGIQVDATGKLNGRGAYLCEREECWEQAVKTDILNKALRTRLTEEDRERIQLAKPQR